MKTNKLALTIASVLLPAIAGNDAASETAAPVVAQMPEQNGIRQPRENTNCDTIWKRASEMSDERQAAVAVADLLEDLTAKGFNPATIKTQYARWRKFHGIEGVVVSDKARAKKEAQAAEKAAKEAEKAAEKEAKAKAKAEAKAAKEAEKAAKEAEKQAKAEAKAEEKARKEAEKAAKKAEAEAAKEADETK